MKSKLKQLRQIKDIAEFNSENIGKNFQYAEIEYIDTSSVTEGRLTTIQKLERKKSPSRAKRLVKNNDIVISTVRPNLKHYYFVKNAQKNLVVSTGFVVIRPIEVDPLYLYYYLITPMFIEYLVGVAESHTSAYPSFPPEIIENAEIDLPDENIQKKIGKILYDLDSQIENLQNQNQILEQIAHSIFKSWFVDFDGVTEFVDSELGPIPKGWKVEKLGNLINHEKGFPFKSSDYKKFGRKIIRSSDLTKDSVNLKKCVCIDQNQVINYQKWILNQNDILITTVGSGMNHPESMVGRVIRVPSFAHQLLLNQNIVRIRAKNMIYHLFLLTKLQQVDFREFLAFRTQGSANQASLTLDTVFGFLIIEPSSEEIKKFYHIAESIYKKINFNQEIQIILTNIRDSLLPKLMSGDIRV